jgi:hypothetical protein
MPAGTNSGPDVLSRAGKEIKGTKVARVPQHGTSFDLFSFSFSFSFTFHRMIEVSQSE